MDYRSENKVSIIGIVTEKFLSNNAVNKKRYLSISVETIDKYTKNGENIENIIIHPSKSWGNKAVSIYNEIYVGDLVKVDGSIKKEEWSDKNNVTHYSYFISISRILLLVEAIEEEVVEEY